MWISLPNPSSLSRQICLAPLQKPLQAMWITFLRSDTSVEKLWIAVDKIRITFIVIHRSSLSVEVIHRFVDILRMS